MDERRNRWIDGWLNGWMDGWIDGLTVWAVGQLDNWMNRCTKYFRIFEATTERKVDGKVSRKWEQTHARVVVEFSVRSGPVRASRRISVDPISGISYINWKYAPFGVQSAAVRCTTSRVFSRTPHESSAKLLKINIKTKLLEHWLCEHFIFCLAFRVNA